MQVIAVDGLPAEAVAAAAVFYGHHVQRVLVAARGLRDIADGAVLIVLPPADEAHREWRLAAVQSLAREAAPVRVNAVAGDGDEAIAAAHDWLATAPGITGQLFALDCQPTSLD